MIEESKFSEKIVSFCSLYLNYINGRIKGNSKSAFLPELLKISEVLLIHCPSETQIDSWEETLSKSISALVLANKKSTKIR